VVSRCSAGFNTKTLHFIHLIYCVSFKIKGDFLALLCLEKDERGEPGNLQNSVFFVMCVTVPYVFSINCSFLRFVQ